MVISTFAGELLQQSAAFDQARWSALLYEELTGEKTHLHMRTDCRSLVESLGSLRQGVTEKRLMSELWAIKEPIDLGEIEAMAHVPTSAMAADGMTKTTPSLRRAVVSVMNGQLILPERVYKVVRRKRNERDRQGRAVEQEQENKKAREGEQECVWEKTDARSAITPRDITPQVGKKARRDEVCEEAP